jgi:hypothetical protein
VRGGDAGGAQPMPVLRRLGRGGVVVKFKRRIDFPDGRDGVASWTAARWESEGGSWRIEVNQVLFGYRVQLARRDDVPPALGRGPWTSYEADYCLGTSRLALRLFPEMIMRILYGQDHVERPDLRFDEDPIVPFVRGLPKQVRRPMANDPECWAKFCELAGVAALAELHLSQDPPAPLVWAFPGVTAEFAAPGGAGI